MIHTWALNVQSRATALTESRKGEAGLSLAFLDGGDAMIAVLQ
jgi:hypothetical protein